MSPPRTAIVTGAGKRVGRALVAALVSDGWQVLAHVHRNSDSVPENAHKVVADLQEPDCAKVIFAAARGLPPVRLLVNNAARFSWDAFGAFDPDEFRAHSAINVQAPALLIERFAMEQEPGEDSLVINILDSKLQSPNADFLSYTLSKHALGTVTDLAARVFAARGVRVNALAPGLMLRSEGQSEKNFESMHKKTPLGRGVEPADLVGAIRYLIEARCVTGQMLVIDAGQRFLRLERDVQFLEDE